MYLSHTLQSCSYFNLYHGRSIWKKYKLCNRHCSLCHSSFHGLLDSEECHGTIAGWITMVGPWRGRTPAITTTVTTVSHPIIEYYYKMDIRIQTKLYTQCIWSMVVLDSLIYQLYHMDCSLLLFLTEMELWLALGGWIGYCIGFCKCLWILAMFQRAKDEIW